MEKAKTSDFKKKTRKKKVQKGKDKDKKPEFEGEK